MAAAVLLAAGCASQKEAVPPDLVWPLPPEKARVRFVETVRSSTDVEPSATSGLMKLLTGDDAATGFTKPYGVHVDTEGRLYVADTGWRKVLVFDYPNKTFRFLGVDGLGILAQPVGVTTDAQDRVYVTDAAQTRVVVYDRDGNYVTAFGGREHLVGGRRDACERRAHTVGSHHRLGGKHKGRDRSQLYAGYGGTRDQLVLFRKRYDRHFYHYHQRIIGLGDYISRRGLFWSSKRQKRLDVDFGPLLELGKPERHKRTGHSNRFRRQLKTIKARCLRLRFRG